MISKYFLISLLFQVKEKCDFLFRIIFFNKFLLSNSFHLTLLASFILCNSVYLSASAKRFTIKADTVENCMEEERYRRASIDRHKDFIHSTIENTTPLTLRSQPKKLTDEDIKQFLKKYNFYEAPNNPDGCFRNVFVDNMDGTVSDYRTGLMWEKGGSDEWIFFDNAKKYIESLNRDKYKGYTDWRIPTLEEAASLIASSALSVSYKGLFIDMFFYRNLDDKVFRPNMWTSDYCEKDSYYSIFFGSGTVSIYHRNEQLLVRAVRSIKTVRSIKNTK